MNSVMVSAPKDSLLLAFLSGEVGEPLPFLVHFTVWRPTGSTSHPFGRRTQDRN
jgi:hypothetical protein